MAEWIEPRNFSHGELVTHLDMEALIRNNLTYLYDALQPVPLIKVAKRSYGDGFSSERLLIQTLPMVSNGGDLLLTVAGDNVGGSARITSTVTETHTISSTGFVTKTVEGKTVQRRTGTIITPRGITLQKTITEANNKIRNIRTSTVIQNKEAQVAVIERQKGLVQTQLNNEYRAVYQDVKEPSREVRVSVPTSRVVTNSYRKEENLTWSEANFYYQIDDGEHNSFGVVEETGEFHRTLLATGIPAGNITLKIYWSNDKGDVSFGSARVSYNNPYRVNVEFLIKQLSGFAL